MTRVDQAKDDLSGSYRLILRLVLLQPSLGIQITVCDNSLLNHWYRKKEMNWLSMGCRKLNMLHTQYNKMRCDCSLYTWGPCETLNAFKIHLNVNITKWLSIMIYSFLPGRNFNKNVCVCLPFFQFLCLKNIRTFLKVCHDKFGLRNSELFDPFDLFDVRDFGKVRHSGFA